MKSLKFVYFSSQIKSAVGVCLINCLITTLYNLNLYTCSGSAFSSINIIPLPSPAYARCATLAVAPVLLIILLGVPSFVYFLASPAINLWKHAQLWEPEHILYLYSIPPYTLSFLCNLKRLLVFCSGKLSIQMHHAAVFQLRLTCDINPSLVSGIPSRNNGAGVSWLYKYRAAKDILDGGSFLLNW